jgi:hypothetical protein
MPSWPPDEAGWKEILGHLPGEGDRAAVRAAIDHTVGEYNARDDEARLEAQQQQRRAADAIDLLSGAIRKLYELDCEIEPMVEQISKLAGPVIEQVRKHAESAQALEARYLPRARNARLFARLTLAWTGPGRGSLSIGSYGPLARFLGDILNRVRPLGPEGIKDALERERARREAINILTQQVLGGQGGMRIDTSTFDIEGNPVDRSHGE